MASPSFSAEVSSCSWTSFTSSSCIRPEGRATNVHRWLFIRSGKVAVAAAVVRRAPIIRERSYAHLGRKRTYAHRPPLRADLPRGHGHSRTDRCDGIFREGAMTSLIKGRLQGARRVVVGPPLCGEMKRPEKNQKGGPLLPICLQSVSSFVAVPRPFTFWSSLSSLVLLIKSDKSQDYNLIF